MAIEGKIRIRLAWDGRHVHGAHIEPRPLVALNTLLRGKQPQDALRMIPMLFSLCAQAQGAAAATALHAATSATSPVIPLVRERSVLAEALQEILWRLLIDLPRIMGAEPQPQVLAVLRKRLAECMALQQESDWQKAIAALEADTNAALLGTTGSSFSATESAASLIASLQAATTPTARLLDQCWEMDGRALRSTTTLLPNVAPDEILADVFPRLDENPTFALCPTWRNQPAESGSLARMQDATAIAQLLQARGPSIATRLIARLAEISELFSRLRAPDVPEDSFVHGAPLGDNTGAAWVQNARGLLLHRVVLDKQGTIADYSLVAPTEWNFHPDGACAMGLSAMAAPSQEDARKQAELLVHSLDPCVAYEIEVHHA
ncbi:nickel-dependent hydrogenase large subunit [Noviherbaspirillum agri]